MGLPGASRANRSSEAMYEVAQIREITREVGKFGGIMRLLFIAERTSSIGTDTIAMSHEFEWQKDVGVSDEELEQASRTLHNLVLQALLTDGWEPVGTDEQGRVMALRRKIGEDQPDGSQSDESSWGMTRPWRAEQKTPTS